MVILAYCNSNGQNSDLLEEAVINKSIELGFEYSIFPETKIHPQFQPDIMDSLLKMNKDIIVCTHSELIMLRGLRRIDLDEITKEDFKIIQYVKSIHKDNNSYWYNVRFNSKGEIGRFKGGVFEQSFNEIFKIGDIEPLK